MLTAFVISLPKCKDRRDLCIKSCEEIGINPIWFEAVNGNDVVNSLSDKNSPYYHKVLQQDELTLQLNFGIQIHIEDNKLTAGEVGCALSHIKIYEKIVNENIPYALIIEDDCTLQSPLKDIIPKVIELKDKWDVVYFSFDSGIRDLFIPKKYYIERQNDTYIKRKGMYYLDPIFNRRRFCLLTSCYLISNKAAKRLIDIAYPIRLPADYLLGLTSFNRLRLFTCHSQNKLVNLEDFPSTIISSNCPRPRHRMK